MTSAMIHNVKWLLPAAMAGTAVLLTPLAPGTALARSADAKLDRTIEETKRSLQQSAALSQKLLSVLADETQPAKSRVQCALLLGKLRYEPAIPKLIELIELHDPDVTVSSLSLEVTSPCAHALADYGVAAVPKIIGAYLKEKTQKRELLLVVAIAAGKTGKEARAYAKGMWMEATDNERKTKLGLLLQELASVK